MAAADGERQLDDALRELAEARAEVARCREELTLFAGQVSHDLRTPLTAVLAHAEMLTGEPVVAESEDLTWMVEGIIRAGHRMDVMIEQMLAYARQGGDLALAVTALDRIFAAALDDLAPLVTETEAEVLVGALPTLPADPDQIYAVVLNVLSNALEFSRPGVPPRIEVQAARVADRWRLTVTDNGIGVPAERREAMFGIFARADKRRGAAGLGLTTARRVVEAHGGRIGMDAAPDGGTTVWFELPA